MVQKQNACECVCIYHMCAFMGVGGDDGTNVCFNSVKKFKNGYITVKTRVYKFIFIQTVIFNVFIVYKRSFVHCNIA
jgi:hypothetical protein